MTKNISANTQSRTNYRPDLFAAVTLKLVALLACLILITSCSDQSENALNDSTLQGSETPTTETDPEDNTEPGTDSEDNSEPGTDGQNSESGTESDNSEPEPEEELPPPNPNATPTPKPEPPAPSGDGRLVVQSTDYHLSTMLPDGDDVVALTEGDTSNKAANWAPDGSRLAWVSTDTDTGATSVVTDRYDLSDNKSITLSGSVDPHYLSWDPSSSKVAYLSESPAGIDLGLVEIADDNEITQRRLDRGSPFGFAWAPTGKNILVHASRFRLDKIDFEEATIIVNNYPAKFGSPTWRSDNTLMFADIATNENGDDTQYLVTTGSSGEGRFPIAQFDGKIRFAASRQGQRIAIQAMDTSDEPAVVTASTNQRPQHQQDTTLGELLGSANITAQQNPEPTPEATPNPYDRYDDSVDEIDVLHAGNTYLMGVYGGDAWTVSDTPTTGIFLSSDGNAIAWCSRIGATDLYEIVIDADGLIYTSPPFKLSNEFLEMAQNFDQYSQSHAQWSPSDNLFVFSGVLADSPNDGDGIWVYNREAETLTRIADGVLASFSQTSSASGAASAA